MDCTHDVKFEVVNLLLKHGCNLDHQANNCRSAFMMANRNRHFHVAKLLLKVGANLKQQTKEGPALMITQQFTLNSPTFTSRITMELNKYHNNYAYRYQE